MGAAWETSNAKGVNGNQANNSMNGAGAAYVFVRNGTTWSQQAYLKASNTNVEATFGWTVTASGDRVVVGAPEEKSAGTGVNGNQADTSASGAGAAYVFRRSGSTWKQQAYLKAANNEAGDNFGLDVGLDGDTLLVGAPLEDSSALGVNGDQSDNGAPAAGAVEVFDLYPGPWTGVGPGLAGVAGTPFLYGEGELAGGDAVTLKLTGAKPLGSATLVIGFSLLAAPFKAGTMVPYPDLLFFGLPTDANGALSLPSTWPTGLPSGVSLWFQDWVADGAGAKGFSASNGLVGTTP